MLAVPVPVPVPVRRPGCWWNCCKSTDPRAKPCLEGWHLDDVDDFDLRGHSNDPRTVKQLDRGIRDGLGAGGDVKSIDS